MSRHNPRVSLQQLIQHTIKAEQVVAGKTYEDFVAEWDTCLLVERLLEIIGKQPTACQKSYAPSIPKFPGGRSSAPVIGLRMAMMPSIIAFFGMP